jgi:hypothetical protein
MKYLRGLLALLLVSGISAAPPQAFNTFVLGLPPASSVAGTEGIPCVKGGSSSQCTPAQIAAYEASLAEAFINKNLTDATNTFNAVNLAAGGSGGVTGLLPLANLTNCLSGQVLYAGTSGPVSCTTAAIAASITSGGILYGSSSSAVAFSGALTVNIPVCGGGAGGAPAPCTTGAFSSSTAGTAALALTNTATTAAATLQTLYAPNLTENTGTTLWSFGVGATTNNAFDIAFYEVHSGNAVNGPCFQLHGNYCAFSFDGGNHIYFESAGAPAVSGGSSPTIDSNATDTSGTATAGSGTVTSFTITFNVGYVVWNHCRVTPHSTIVAFAYSYTKTVITITGTSLTSDVFDYDCDGH